MHKRIIICLSILALVFLINSCVNYRSKINDYQNYVGYRSIIDSIGSYYLATNLGTTDSVLSSSEGDLIHIKGVIQSNIYSKKLLNKDTLTTSLLIDSICFKSYDPTVEKCFELKNYHGDFSEQFDHFLRGPTAILEALEYKIDSLPLNFHVVAKLIDKNDSVITRKIFNHILYLVNPDDPNNWGTCFLNTYSSPFSPISEISYIIPDSSHVLIVLYNILGQIVDTLENQNRIPDYYKITPDFSKLNSGVYFYKITAGDFTETKKIILLK